MAAATTLLGFPAKVTHLTFFPTFQNLDVRPILFHAEHFLYAYAIYACGVYGGVYGGVCDGDDGVHGDGAREAYPTLYVFLYPILYAPRGLFSSRRHPIYSTREVFPYIPYHRVPSRVARAGIGQADL